MVLQCVAYETQTWYDKYIKEGEIWPVLMLE